MIEHTRDWFNKNKNIIFKDFTIKECCNCKVKSNLHIHHIIPLAIGGTNYFSNLCLLCEDCHSKIHNHKLLNHKELQKKGIEDAKLKGVHMGRPIISLTDKQMMILEENYQKWVEKEIKSVDFIKMLDLKKNTFYKIIKEYR